VGATNAPREPRTAAWLDAVTTGRAGGPAPVHDARRLPDGTVLDYDVCIVGSGAAGATAALVLAGRGLRIAVLEGGGLAPDMVTAGFTAIESIAGHVDQASRERWLGGTTNAWTGGKTTLDDIDLRPRSWVPGSGWPIDPARLRDCYRRAADLLDRPGPEVFDAAGASPADGFRFDSGELRTLVFHEDDRPLRFGTLLRERARPGDGIDVVVLANVTEVVLDDAGERVAGVQAATVGGRRIEVRAPVVLLACGAIENARLLLASRSRRPAGLGNTHDQVGRHFQDHPKGYTGLVDVAPAARRLPASGYWTGQPAMDGRLRWGVGLTEATQARDEVLNSYVRLEPVVLDTVPAAVAALRKAARGRVRGLDPRVLADLPSEAPALARLARFRARNEGPIDLVRVRTFMEQEPRAASRVRLSDRCDPLGLPLAAVDWSLSELDRRSVRVLHERLAAAFRHHGLGELHADLDEGSEVWSSLGDASHHAGTTRMGTDPRTSVAGPDGQVHDVGGLYVAGASLFPTSGYANPVFTIAALTLHVADHVADRLSAPPATVTTTPPPRLAEAAATRPTAAGVAEAKRWLAARRRARRLSVPASRAIAVVWPAPGQVAALPVEVPEPGQGQLSVLVEASAVSVGTERARWRGLPGASVNHPHHPGYSLSGVVRSVGPGVYDVEPGARVAVWGAPHQSLVTVGRAQVHVLDPGTGFVEASLVTLGAIAELGVARAGDVAGRPVTVIGAGAIGLLAQRIAAAAGASPCSVVAASTAKDGVVRGDPSARLCPPAGVDHLGAAVVIEATGAPEGLELAVRAAAPGATVVLLGTTRAESTSFPLDVVHARGLRVVGAHAGLLDVAGGIDGLDRRRAAQRFLDRQAAGEVRVDDLVTQRVDPTGVADFYDRLAHDRTQVVPVVEWWRLAPDLRARPGAMTAPNPFRRGLAAGTVRAVAPGRAGGPVADVVEHPPAPARPAVEPVAAAGAGGGTPLTEAAAAVATALAREGVADGATVQVTGGGRATDEVQKAVADRGLPVAVATGGEPAPGGHVDVVVDLDPTAASVAAGLALLGPTGRLVVGGRVDPIELDVQTEIHKRGATVVGTAPDGARWQHG
jgi:choline dehydrogenase-like flavoprotein/threonine dehydrogenase-like Zn-dependent dehydrogenase